jgi:cyclopropane-fatty-acyl-phospholipid synthase
LEAPLAPLLPPVRRGIDAIAARRFAEAVSRGLGHLAIRVEFWDGTVAGDLGEGAIVIRLNSPRALDRLVGALPDRAFGRAFSEGLIDIDPLEGFLEATTLLASSSTAHALGAALEVIRCAVALGARPDVHPTREVEVRLRGRRHSVRRDADAVRHHYDLPEAFYALFLDQTLTYSCAYFADERDHLESAQQAKHDIVCRKLRLRPGERLLDVGCGWGSLVIHAAERWGVQAVGITLSPRQAEVARRTVLERGLQSKVTILLADYRQNLGNDFDAIASIGMVEHVGTRRIDDFAAALFRSLRPGGRLLLHGITRPQASAARPGPFIDRFVFPDGELQPISWREGRMEAAGFELRDTESLREHYALTVERWLERLRARWDEAVALVGEERTRVWLLYLAGSVVGFRLGAMSIYQSLLVRPAGRGRSGMPLRRSDWYPPDPEPRD